MVQERAELLCSSQVLTGEELRAPDAASPLLPFPLSYLSFKFQCTPNNKPSSPHLLLTSYSEIAQLLFIPHE